jgi:hypothetical protein
MKQLWGGETSWEERDHERRHHWRGEMLLFEAEMVAQKMVWGIHFHRSGI